MVKGEHYEILIKYELYIIKSLIIGGFYYLGYLTNSNSVTLNKKKENWMLYEATINFSLVLQCISMLQFFLKREW